MTGETRPSRRTGRDRFDTPDMSTLPDASSPLFALYLCPKEGSRVRPFPAHRHHDRMCEIAEKIARQRHGATIERAVANRARELTIQLVPLSAALRDLDAFEETLRIYVDWVSAAIEAEGLLHGKR